MFNFDIYTVIFMSMLLHFTMGLLFAAIYSAGLGGKVLLWWSLALIIVSIGIGLLMFRDPVVAQWTLPTGNLLIFGGTLLSIVALRRLMGIPVARVTTVVAVVWILVCTGYIMFAGDEQYVRSLLSTATLSAFTLLIVASLAFKPIPNGSGLSHLIVVSGYTAMFIGFGTLAMMAGLSRGFPDAIDWPSPASQVLWAFMLGPSTMIWSSVGCLGVVLDNANRDSRANLQRAEAVVRKNPLAIILTEAETRRIIDVNDAFLQMFELGSGEVLGQNADDLDFLEPQRSDDYWRLLSRNGLVSDLIVVRDTHDGKDRTLKISGHRLSLGTSDYYLTFINDVSDEMLAADILRREKEIAQHEAREKSRFLAMMSHEFRTPLSAAAGLATLLKSDEEEPGKRRKLDGILESMSVLTHLVEDVLDLSRLQNNDFLSVTGVCVPTHVIERVEAICGPAAARKELDLKIDIDPRLPDQIIADQNRVAQVIINLMHNAIKFTDSGTVTLYVGRAASDGQAGERLVFEVRDTGPGITHDAKEQLFEPFYQGKSAKKHDGVGLGLSICQQLVTMMDGDITAHNNPGGGSVFRVTLPLKIAPAAVPPRPSREMGSDTINQWTGLRVLIAEDAGLNREVLAEQLDRVGAEVVPVADGGPACTLAAVAEPPFDVVLLDMHMQGISGPEASLRLRATPRGKSVLIAALTAYSEEGDRKACEAAGMDLFFSKPYDLGEMGRQMAASGVMPRPQKAAVSEPRDTIGFDVISAAGNWKGDATPLATLLTRFADAYADIRGQLTGLLHQERLADLQTTVHQIRGIAAVLRAQHLKTEAARLEALIMAGGVADLAAELARLEQLIEAHVALILSSYAVGPAGETVPPASPTGTS